MKTENNLQLTENNVAEIPPKVDTAIAIYQNASMLKIEPKEQADLLASFGEKEIEIRPDGLIYLPQAFWRKRLNQVFGVGQWCLIIQNQVKDTQASKLYLQAVLMIRGSYVSTAVGEAELHADNPLQSWASVWESAKSDCITRCCKDIGIASELWQPQFILAWCRNNAVKVFVTKKDGKKGVQWRKKDAAKFYNETGIVPENEAAQQQSQKEQPKTDPQKETPPPVNNAKSMNGQAEKPWLNNGTKEFENAHKKFYTGTIDLEEIMKHYRISDATKELLFDARTLDHVKQ